MLQLLGSFSLWNFFFFGGGGGAEMYKKTVLHSEFFLCLDYRLKCTRRGSSARYSAFYILWTQNQAFLCENFCWKLKINFTRCSFVLFCGFFYGVWGGWGVTLSSTEEQRPFDSSHLSQPTTFLVWRNSNSVRVLITKFELTFLSVKFNSV